MRFMKVLDSAKTVLVCSALWNCILRKEGINDALDARDEDEPAPVCTLE